MCRHFLTAAHPGAKWIPDDEKLATAPLQCTHGLFKAVLEKFVIRLTFLCHPLTLRRICFRPVDLLLWLKLCFKSERKVSTGFVFRLEKQEWLNDIKCIRQGTPLAFSWINNKWAGIGVWRHQLHCHSGCHVQYVGNRNEKWIAALCSQFSLRLLAFFLLVWRMDCMEI